MRKLVKLSVLCLLVLISLVACNENETNVPDVPQVIEYDDAMVHQQIKYELDRLVDVYTTIDCAYEADIEVANNSIEVHAVIFIESSDDSSAVDEGSIGNDLEHFINHNFGAAYNINQITVVEKGNY